MGYTHYWSARRDFSDQEWTSLVSVARILFKEHSLASFDGTGDPEVNTSEIAFNGCEDESHESVNLSRYATDFEFCKTARKPYDQSVVAILEAASIIAPAVFEYKSDGDESDLEDGRALARDLLARIEQCET